MSEAALQFNLKESASTDFFNIPQDRNCFFDGQSKSYLWPKEDVPGYKQLNLTDIRRELKGLGYSAKVEQGELLSPLDQHLSWIFKEHYVDRSGPIAGHRCGLVLDEKTGQKLLVTNEPQLIEPVKGDFPTIRQFLGDLLGEDANWLIAWLAVGLRNLRGFMYGRELYMPGPAIALCGPRQCGKTLLIEIIGRLFGRKQSCYNWLLERTNFNSELIGTELLVCDDESGNTDLRARRNVGNRIKSALFSGTVKGEKKGKEAFTTRPWWRIIIACNDEPEDLRVLPPIDDSMVDKISIFKCHRNQIVMPEASRTERWAQLEAEMPAFAYFLEYEYQIPEEMKDLRTGAKAYQNPEILSALSSLGAEMQLLQLIDDVMWHRLPNTYSARDVEKYLKDPDSTTCYEARQLLRFPTACGVYLSRLATVAPERVIPKGQKYGINQYEIRKGGEDLKE